MIVMKINKLLMELLMIKINKQHIYFKNNESLVCTHRK